MNNIELLITALADVADECDNRELYSEAETLTEALDFLVKVANINKEAYIEQVKQKGNTKYVVRSEKNPDWKGGTFSSKDAAKKRLQQVEMFKHMKDKRKKTRKHAK